MDKAHEETNQIIIDIEKQLESEFKSDLEALLNETDEIIEKIHLDGENSNKQRLEHAKNNGLDKLIIILVAYSLFFNEKSLSFINNSLSKIFAVNYKFISSLFTHDKNNNIPIQDIDTLKAFNNYDKRAYDKLKDESFLNNQITKEVKRMIKRGLGIDKMTERIKIIFRKNYSSARRIARTESTRLENYSRYQMYSDMLNDGFLFDIQWIATKDNRTRDSHSIINGEIVKLNQTFSNGLYYPADPNGSAEEVCNCRCTTRPTNITFIGS